MHDFSYSRVQKIVKAASSETQQQLILQWQGLPMGNLEDGYRLWGFELGGVQTRHKEYKIPPWGLLG